MIIVKCQDSKELEKVLTILEHKKAVWSPHKVPVNAACIMSRRSIIDEEVRILIVAENEQWCISMYSPDFCTGGPSGFPILSAQEFVQAEAFKLMNIFYATFGSGYILRDHILKVHAIDESHAREQLNNSKLLQTCVAFIYDETEGLKLIERYGYTVINGALDFV